MARTYRPTLGGIASAWGLWRNLRFQRFAFQAAFAAVVVVFAYLILTNIDDSLGARNLEPFPFINVDGEFPFLHFEKAFLDARAGFSIDQRSFGFDYTPNDNYGRALAAGLLNTIKVALIGIILATALGIFVGVGRLSRNWLVSRLAAVYVDTVRNVPLLVQLIFWYLAVFLKAPPIGESISFFDLAFISNRAVAIPGAGSASGFGAWLLVLAGGLIAAAVVKSLLRRREQATGKPSYPWGSAIGVFLVAAVIGGLVLTPISFDKPERGATSFSGGATLTPEFAALLTGLVIYTAAFIAEIVRGSILAIPKGQTEAAMALGLNSFQRMRYVILPQAMRIIIPPLTNQYLNLTKNSSLAVAVAFKDLFDVARISMNQSGQFLPLLLLVMFAYLLMSLTISFVMNTINSRLKWGSR